MSGSAVAISDDEFARLMDEAGPFGRDRRVIVAVSGGPDSMALAILLARWGQPLAIIVDHGLRPGSGAEAALVATRLAAPGVESRILTAAIPPGPALAERARAARYALLFGACASAGVPDLLLGHHAGDQAETVRMRHDAGSGSVGLAGMAVVSYQSAARLLRPLLAIDPARLRATLRAAGVAWIEDPTNTDRRTARGRLRADLTEVDRGAALALAADSSTARAGVMHEVATELAGVRLAPEGFAVVPADLGAAALSALIWMISGRVHPPPRAGVARGLAARTLHGVLIRSAGRLGPGRLLAREPAAIGPPVEAGRDMIWDGRFRFRQVGAEPIGIGLTLGALGPDSASVRAATSLPATVLASLPALRCGSTLVAVPHLAFPDRDACRSVSVELWPRRQAAPSI